MKADIYNWKGEKSGSVEVSDAIFAREWSADLVHQGDFGKMVALRGRDIIAIPFKEALVTRKVDEELYRIASTFFG